MLYLFEQVFRAGWRSLWARISLFFFFFRWPPCCSWRKTTRLKFMVTALHVRELFAYDGVKVNSSELVRVRGIMRILQWEFLGPRRRKNRNVKSKKKLTKYNFKERTEKREKKKLECASDQVRKCPRYRTVSPLNLNYTSFSINNKSSQPKKWPPRNNTGDRGLP